MGNGKFGVSRRLTGAGLILLMGAMTTPPRLVVASDHLDAPSTMGDPIADIADFYAWHTERGTVVAILTFAPFAPGELPAYDAEVAYVVSIDNTFDPSSNSPVFEDNTADIQIVVRFGQNDQGTWGVQFNGVPGADDEVFDGPVDTMLSNGSAAAMAGAFDDPFFFDYDGFVETVVNLQDDSDPVDLAFASLMGLPPRDSYAGRNVMAIVIEFDAAAAVDPFNYLHMWAETARL